MLMSVSGDRSDYCCCLLLPLGRAGFQMMRRNRDCCSCDSDVVAGVVVIVVVVAVVIAFRSVLTTRNITNNSLKSLRFG